MSNIYFGGDDFISSVLNHDLQRTNNFSVAFSSSPMESAGNVLEKIGGIVFNNQSISGADIGMDNLFGNLLGSIISEGANRVVQNLGINKIIIGAANNRIIQSILGEFVTGQSIITFFGLNRADRGMYVKSVRMPSSSVNYAHDHTYSAPNIKVFNRKLEPLILTFRTDKEALNYRAMKEWNDSIIDPVTGLVAFVDEVSANVQVNYHDRNGIPHTTNYFEGCVPVSVTPTVLSHDDSNKVLEFDVEFAYRRYHVGVISMEDALKWVSARMVERAIDKMDIPDLSDGVFGPPSKGGIGPSSYPNRVLGNSNKGRTKSIFK